VFHAAALMALEVDLGWDSRTADVVVGTSAGALMGLLTRMDVSGTDLAAMISEVPHHADHELVANRIVTARLGLAAFLPSVRPSHLLNGSLKRHPRNPAAALLSLYPTGDVDFLTLLDFITTHNHNTWPAGDLRICSVRSDFTRVVWDASSSVDLDLAVASSCSLPGYAQGAAIDGWT
jgi:NTE family protein